MNWIIYLRKGRWSLLYEVEKTFRIAAELQYFWEDMFQNLSFKMLYLIGIGVGGSNCSFQF